MAFRRRWLLVFVLFILSGANLWAASREERAFAAAAAAFQDGFYDRAEAGFNQFIQRYSQSPRLAEAVLLQAQAQIKQGKYTAAINSLNSSWANPGSLADQYAYWLGEAEFAQGDYARSAAAFTNLVGKFPRSPLGLTAVVEAAAAFERLGEWPAMARLLDGTNTYFQQQAALQTTNELVVRGWLLLARSQLAQENFPAAFATLKLLDGQALSPGLDWQRANLICRVQAGAGDLEAALLTTTNLLQLARSQDAERLADSIAWRGTILERLGRWAEAGSVWSENLLDLAPPEWQREAVMRIAGAALVQGKISEARTALENYLTKFPDAPAVPLARLTLGELHLKQYLANPTATNQLALAQARFDQVLNATNSPESDILEGKARLDRGWTYWFAGRIAESLGDFTKAAAMLPFSEDLAVAKFKMGDAQFALKDYVGAKQSYQAMLDQFANVPSVMKSLGDHALYQVLRANLEIKDLTGADMAMRQLLERFPASDLADNGQMLLGEGFSEAGATTNALQTFKDFAVLFPESALTPQVELARARTYEGASDWPAAITTYREWLGKYPTNGLRPQVEYALGRAAFQAGDETMAFAVMTNLVAGFPTNALAPLAQWWVADHYYRLGTTNYPEAERNYELIFQTPSWRSSELYFPAQMMAGRAAAGRLGYWDAANYYSKLASDTNCPSALATEALFAYGGVLMRMDSPDTNRPLANFELATNLFNQLAINQSTNQLGALALSELGDCNLQLGAFEAATNAYARVLSSPSAGVALRSRAQVGLGRVLEKMADQAPPDSRAALQAQALKYYLDVLYSEEPQMDPFWTKKAGLLALPLVMKNRNADVDKFIDRLEVLLPALKESLEAKRAAAKN